MGLNSNCRSFCRAVSTIVLLVLVGSSALLAEETGGKGSRVVTQMSAARLKPGQYGWTELMEATVNGDDAGVERLLGQGADVNARDQSGATALMIAAEGGHTAIVDKLLARGADVNFISERGTTALSWAVGRGHAEIVNALLDKGAKVHIEYSSIGHFLGKGEMIQTGNRGARSLLETAAVTGNIDILQALVRHGADLHEEGGPALLAAAMQSNRDMRGVVRTLLDDGVSVDTQYRDGTPVLVVALEAKNIDTAKLLLNRGARVDWPEIHNASLLQHAVRTNSADIVQAMLAKGVDVNAPNKSGQTPLIVAAREGLPKMVDVLLAHGATLNARDHEGVSALEYADEAGQTGVVQTLLARQPAGKAASALVYFKPGDHKCDLERWDPVTRNAQTLRALDTCPTLVFHDEETKAVMLVSGNAIQEVSLQPGATPTRPIPLPVKKGEEALLYSDQEDRTTSYALYQVGRLADKRMAVAYGRSPNADDRHFKSIYLAYDGKNWERIGKEVHCYAATPCAPGPIQSHHSSRWRRVSAIWHPFLTKNPFVIKRGIATNLPVPREARSKERMPTWRYLTFLVHGHESIVYHFSEHGEESFGLYTFAISLQTSKDRQPVVVTDQQCDTAIEHHYLLVKRAFGDASDLIDLETGEKLFTGLKNASWVY